MRCVRCPYVEKADPRLSRFKETTPYAIVNMQSAVKDMRDYINNYVFQAMEFWLIGKDIWIQETFKFARQYMTYAVSSDKRCQSVMS